MLANRLALLAASVIGPLLLLIPMPVPGQSTDSTDAARPAPRWPDGTVRLGSPPGESGLWTGSGRLAVNPTASDAPSTRNAPVHIDDVPLQSWARALLAYRHEHLLKDEPHTRCKPSPGPRQMMTPYGVEILDAPELRRIYIFNTGGPHSYRIIYMDNRTHPEYVSPSYYGHSVGRWEGDTLVVDTVGFNERTWMNRDALPHTEQLHLIERLTRVDFHTLNYQVTIDDPGAYTAPWTSGFSLTWSEGAEMFEYICQENNFAPELMVGGEESAERGSRIVP